MGFMDFLSSSGGGGLVGSAIGAVGSLFGGKSAAKAQAKANAQNLALAREQMALQKEFAQNGVRWKVADAQAAGIHPLAALGANTASYTPTAAMVEPVNDSGLGQALSQMGQGVSRAFEAKQLKEEREAAQARQEMADVFNMARSQKELEHMDLQNEFLRTQIIGAKNAVTKTALPPPMPSSVQNFPNVNTDTPIPMWGWSYDDKGRVTGVIPSDALKSRTEDVLGIEWLPWVGAGFRNAVAKIFGQAVDGMYWHGEKVGFKPYPPKKGKGFFDYAKDAFNYYRR